MLIVEISYWLNVIYSSLDIILLCTLPSISFIGGFLVLKTDLNNARKSIISTVLFELPFIAFFLSYIYNLLFQPL